MPVIIPDSRYEMPELFIPGMKPVGVVEIDWEDSAKDYSLRTLAFPSTGGVITYSRKSIEKKIAKPNGTDIGSTSDAHGIGITGLTAASTQTVQLEDGYTDTNAGDDGAYTPVGDNFSFLLILKKNANGLTGSHPLFGVNSPTKEPYIAYGFGVDGDTDGITFVLQTTTTYVSGNSVSLGGLAIDEYAVFMATYDGSLTKGYKNGQWVGNSSVTGSIYYPSDNTTGAAMLNFYQYTGQNRLYPASIKLAAIFDRALTAEEVSAISANPYQFLIPG